MKRRNGSHANGVTLIELLIAALIVTIVAAGAVSSWSISSKMPATLRSTEISSRLAVREIEKVKAQRYTNVANGTTITYYDKSGAVTTDTASIAYLATTTVGLAPGMPVTNPPTTKDLLEVTCTVTNAAGTQLEVQRTLLTFGGI